MPDLPFLPYGRQSITDADIEAVIRTLKSDFLTCGPEVEAFEQDFASAVGARHAVAVCNATAALHLAMRVSGLGPGDRVMTSPITFVSSANAAAFVGAIPDFIDVDPQSINLDPALLESNWQPDTRAVVAVDYAGNPAAMPAIAAVARKHGATVIEDASHATGGVFLHEGRTWKTGGHPWADMTVFSFHPVKTLTSGEGGMLVTDSDSFADKARLLRSHGLERNPDKFQPSPLQDPRLSETGPWSYQMQELGYNYRITDLQCALGRSQLARLPSFIQRRQALFARYQKAFSHCPLLTLPCPATSPELISWHLYTLQMDFDALGVSRTQVMEKLRAQGIGSQVLYIPVHLQPWYREHCGYDEGKCPVAEAFYRKALSLPLYPSLSNPDQDRVIEAVQRLTTI